ncbi:hypothetical protein P3L10_025187 [Capsicum annuum]
MSTPKGRVKLNVGGRIFETTVTTLEIAGEDSLFRAMLDKNWNPHSDSDFTEHLIDRNPDCFGVFDGNRPRLARSIAGWSVRDGEITRAIQASPSGGCCAAHGSIVHVYDCMLEQCCAINLDYNEVNNLCWIDSENIVVSTDGKLGSGGMGLFNASTGELRYKFQVTDKLKGYTSGALGFSPDNKLFSSCTGPGDQHGIDFLDGSPYRSQNNASSCSGYMYWSYYEDDQTKQLRDVVAIEERSSICVVDWNECLRFMDLRIHCGSDWVPTSQFQQSRGGPIWGFSIGGARLFALHRNEYVLDVWDAPRSPVN